MFKYILKVYIEKNYRDDLTILIVVTKILSLFPGLYDGFVEGYEKHRFATFLPFRAPAPYFF